MSKIVTFNKGEELIHQGDEETTAYMIQSGWVLISQSREEGSVFQVKIGPGEIIGELSLAGLVDQRSASVTAITDVEAEEIDRGALIRLVNGPASRLTPVLGALLSRLKSAMVNEKQDVDLQENDPAHAVIVCPTNISKPARCTQPCTISTLPLPFVTHLPPPG